MLIIIILTIVMAIIYFTKKPKIDTSFFGREYFDRIEQIAILQAMNRMIDERSQSEYIDLYRPSKNYYKTIGRLASLKREDEIRRINKGFVFPK